MKIFPLFFALMLPVMATAPIELAKPEALELMNVQFEVLAMEADLRALYAKRESLVKSVMEKYKVTMETHSIDIKTGQLVPKVKEQDAKKTK